VKLPLASKPSDFCDFYQFTLAKSEELFGWSMLPHFPILSLLVHSSISATVEARFRGGLDECSIAEKQVKVVDSSKSPEGHWGHWGRSGQVKATKTA
jgi:hypothetical protein